MAIHLVGSDITCSGGGGCVGPRLKAGWAGRLEPGCYENG
jgi:hypothetical protein